MANDFSKQEKVAFDQLLEAFQDALVLSRNVSVYNTEEREMERSGDTIWRPAPVIMTSYDGVDMTDNFKDVAQLSVPASINVPKSVPFYMSPTELRDSVQAGNFGKSAKNRLASDINMSIMDVATSQGSLVVDVEAAASGFSDVALCEAIMNETGVMSEDRYLALSTTDYNGMASNLASRDLSAAKALNAYERAYVGRIASFETYKLDYANRIAAAAGTTTFDNRTVTARYYTPQSTSVGTTGRNNVDNRFQTITVSSTTSVAAGDAFTIAGINAVHMIAKKNTGKLKTFRVVSVDSGSTMTITPPIISAQGGTGPELQYQNCVVNTESETAALVYLNTTAANINPFWHKDALEILPGNYAVSSDSGLSVMKGSTDQGFTLAMYKQASIDNLRTKYRVDAYYGVVNKAPEMSGILICGQT